MSFPMLVKRHSGNIFKAYITFHSMYAPQGFFLTRRRMTLDGWFMTQGRMMSKENVKPIWKPEEIVVVHKIA